eukprot:c9642_g1_i1.p1 GENE.c9642_g1_i1~~c9642_g1_i1.p1  ORF type:complete len:261 (+),score=56.62 c9642_g1_i1:88-870(+)
MELFLNYQPMFLRHSQLAMPMPVCFYPADIDDLLMTNFSSHMMFPSSLVDVAWPFSRPRFVHIHSSYPSTNKAEPIKISSKCPNGKDQSICSSKLDDSQWRQISCSWTRIKDGQNTVEQRYTREKDSTGKDELIEERVVNGKAARRRVDLKQQQSQLQPQQVLSQEKSELQQTHSDMRQMCLSEVKNSEQPTGECISEQCEQQQQQQQRQEGQERQAGQANSHQSQLDEQHSQEQQAEVSQSCPTHHTTQRDTVQMENPI